MPSDGSVRPVRSPPLTNRSRRMGAMSLGRRIFLEHDHRVDKVVKSEHVLKLRL